ncbi:cellulose synthase/poly-beta-1,6-N-acetylglucosamine synthase-like glycosyltransferase [Leeuwenhoekiella aestuarii]|uniref:Cellulose synthase/poly-beta-1,6-N-acetylglucosamine synthase-like glycosyltransferase n=1 Tax=Leeuwenhoekiella aestuarii TaxID=2249426 RepID=A0A4Q0P032_9FLAO|nr:cellulose synthase/poly-beta-1,6-N-acetylglucosamine synthase-like glycosyltransferase [Leeuwenhoekiella aestuarii]RXG19802.1 cellulose synthase/poly-beta-1,6-N-acetylglucosamine synthase-like glycosyltransferase [Leeuwenhoekiella aestuarii]
MILISAILILYALLIVFLCFGFKRLKTDKLKSASTHLTSFSIIIPFRNEAENLNTLLESLSNLNYPKSYFEIILIDDASTDASVALIEAFKQQAEVSIIVLENERFSASPKKDALTKGINTAQFEWIITTDADCKLPDLWLQHYDQKIRAEDSKFIAGPVSFFTSAGFLDRFQQLDFLSLQGATIGSFGLLQAFMCNGANLAFSKTEFLILNGYAQTDHLASGDDVFLMQKFIKEIPEKVHYLKTSEALVLTQTQPNWKSLIEQRKRWAAKASAYTSWFAVLISLLVLLGNASLFLVIFYPEIWPLILLKIAVDFLLIWQTASLFNQKKSLIYFPLVAVTYPIFTVYIALASQFGKFEWKGRVFNK